MAFTRFPGRTIVALAAGFFTLGSVATVAHAQVTAGGFVLNSIADGRTIAINAPDRLVRVLPAIATIDHKTRTLSIELVNPSDDTLTADLAMGVKPPEEPVKDTAKAAEQGGGFVAQDSAAPATATATAKADVIPADQSLAKWVTGVPEHVKLLPHEKKKVTLHLTVPASAKSGEYAGWLVATTTSRPQFMTVVGSASGGMMLMVAASDDAASKAEKSDDPETKVPKPQSGAKIVYHVGE